MVESKIVNAVIGLFLAGILLPVALGEIFGANTTGWDSATATVFTKLLPVLGTLGIAVYVWKKR
jgi:hypothetical protein